MNYLLDTNICIYIMNQHPLSVVDAFRKVGLKQCNISSITVSELQFGVFNSKKQAANQQHLTDFLAPFTILDYPYDATPFYGKLRADLKRSGQSIGPLDLLIAAHAIRRKLTLVTHNTDEFSRIDGLRIVDWQ